MRPLLIGEQNPYQSDPRLAQRFALYPDPPGCAGWRLCHKVMQLEEGDYLTRFDRVNLCDGKWSVREARRKADDISRDARTYVLFGAKVSSVFGWLLNREDFKPFTRYEEAAHVHVPRLSPLSLRRPRSYIILPHPSGLSRAWNEPGAFERARAVLREAGVL